MFLRIVVALLLVAAVAMRYGDDLSKIAIWVDKYVSPGQKLFESHTSTLAIGDLKNFLVTSPLIYRVKDSANVIIVPKGFATDLASIPLPFRWILPRDGKYVSAAIVHDYLYWIQRCTRSESDGVLLLAMDEYGVNIFQRWLIYAGVRIGGFWSWRVNKQSKEEGNTKFVSSEFVDTISSKPVTAKESLEDVLKAAKSAGQLLFKAPAKSDVNAACKTATNSAFFWRSHGIWT